MSENNLVDNATRKLILSDRPDQYWVNRDNAQYYESVSIKSFTHQARIGGFDRGCDIDLALPYLDKADSILEIGAGYGRVLACLIRRGVKGQLYALERSSRLCSSLKKQFKNKATIYHDDLSVFAPNRKFEVILWLWSGISDFSKTEQMMMLKRIISFLAPSGTLILDTMLHTLKPINSSNLTYENQCYCIQKYGCKVQGYIPSAAEIDEYIKALNLKLLKRIHYKTLTNRERILHIINT